MQPPAVVSLRYPVLPDPEAWVIPEGPVPEATAHHTAVHHIYGLLTAWAKRLEAERPVRVANELAVRWLKQHPRTGIDPDLAVLDPAPPDFDDLSALKLWEAGRVPPRLALEVVSSSHPYKDYAGIQERYAAMGVEELVVFDPLLEGPRSLGGPVPLQLWRRQVDAFERVHFGQEPAYSMVLDAWLIADGRVLHIADDRKGRMRWLTEAERATAEAERATAEAERATAEAKRERSAREDLERRVRELEARQAR